MSSFDQVRRMQNTRTKTSDSHPPTPQRCPWLVFSHGKREPTQTFFSIPENQCYMKHIPDMSQKYICTCSHGWLVLLDMLSDDCFLWNPISALAKIKLPPWNSFTMDTCILSLPPTDPSCIVFAFARSEDGLLYLRFCQPGDDEWVNQELGSEDEMLTCPASCEGKIYGLMGIQKTLVVLDVIGSTISLKKLVAITEDPCWSFVPETTRSTSYLVESRNELFRVKISYLGDTQKIRDMEVYKMDFSRLTWVEVESLGDRAFFINPSCGNNMSCDTAESGIKGNCIYYIIRGDKSLYVFDLEDSSMSISLPCSNVVRNWIETVWIMPQI